MNILDMNAKAVEEVKEFNTDNPKTEVEQTARGSEPAFTPDLS